MTDVERALANAVKSGALIKFQAELDDDEMDQRRLWLRPEVESLLRPGRLNEDQIEIVRAALKRFIVGGRYMVVTADCPHREVQALGDIRELKGSPPPFIEVRFRPPPYDLRLFGRFVEYDGLVLTTFGAKAQNQKRAPSLSRSRRTQALRCGFCHRGLQINWAASEIRQCLSNASFV